jgi:hypothetical protein
MTARIPVVIVDGIRKSLPEADSVDGLVTPAELEARVPEEGRGPEPTETFLRGDSTWAEVVHPDQIDLIIALG